MIELLDKSQKIDEFFGVSPVISISVKVTRKCNLRCRHCYVNGKCKEKDIDINDLESIVSKLHGKGLQKLYLNGGEPFLNNDIYHFFEFAYNHKLDISCSSNGMVLQKDGLQRLALYQPHLIQVSVDGTEKVHNSIRGDEKSYENAINCLKEARKIFNDNTQLVMAFTIMEDNKHDLLNMLDIAKDLSVDTFCIIPLMPSSEKKFLAKDLSAIEQNLLIQKCVKKYMRRYSTDFELSLIVPPGLIPKALKRRKFGQGYLCSFPSMLGIDVDGTVAPCDGFLDNKEFIIGNIFDNDLSDILNSKIYQKLMNWDYTKLTGVCNKCIFLEECQGGCRVAAYNRYSSFNAPDPICQQYFEAGIFPSENLKNG